MGGIIHSSIGDITPERYGLGDVGARWYDLRILQKGYDITLEPDQSRAVVPFKIGWDRRFQLAAELLGYPYWDAENKFKRMLPERFRNWEYQIIRDGLDDPTTVAPTPVMHCTRILSIKPLSGGGAQANDKPVGGDSYYPDPQYDWAEVTALFQTLPYNVKLLSDLIDSDNKPVELQRYVIKTEEGGGRYLQFQWGQWGLKNGALYRGPLARQLNFFEPFKLITWEWLDVLPQAVYMSRADGFLGKTNKVTFDDYPPERLLLQKFDRKPTMTQLGIRTFRVIMQAYYFPSGVNRARPPALSDQNLSADGYWDIVDDINKTDKPYKGVNFADLFRP